jgi:ABC-2 type transport system permease protein
MTRLLLGKCWRESRWLLLGCAAATFAFCWLRVWVVSRLSTDRFRAVLEMLPGEWRKLLAVDFDWLISYPGRISLAYQELIVVLCISVWGIARGSDMISGEVNRGTMEMLLAQPFSRARILLTQTVMIVTGSALLALSAWGGTAVGVYSTAVKEEVRPSIPLPLSIPGIGSELRLPFGETRIRQVPMREKVDVRVFLPATANLFALGVAISGFSALMSSWDRYRWRTIGLVTGTLIIQLLLKIAGMAIEGWQWLTSLSALSAYVPEAHARIADQSPQSVWACVLVDADGRWTGIAPLGHDIVLIGIGIVSFVLAAIVFVRRDLPAPL